MRHILILLSFLLLTSTLIFIQILGTAYAQEKQKACLAPIGALGDTFDRYYVRIAEMRESVKIITQCIEQIEEGPIRTEVPFIIRPPVGEAYCSVEGPKGELGFYMVSDGGISPYRCKVRAPSFLNLTPLRDMLKGWKMGDLIIILGSIDIVLGEVDR